MRDATCEMLHVTCLFSRPEFHSKPTFDNLQYNVGKCQIVAAGPTEDRRRTDTNLSPEGHRWPGGQKDVGPPSIIFGGPTEEQWAALRRPTSDVLSGSIFGAEVLYSKAKAIPLYDQNN